MKYGDLISRQAAIEAINKAFERVFAWDGTSPLGDKVLENVPSVQPEQIARDIATIIENEQDMRVVLKNAEHTETHSCDCEHTETHDWIPVTERLPKEEDCPMDCLVTRKSKFIGNYTDMAVCEKNGTWTHEDWDAIVLGDVKDGKSTGLISTRDDNIIAWMPLPEPWKGEAHEL